MRATWPLTEDFSRSMLLLHWPNWRQITDIKQKDSEQTWVDIMLAFLESDQRPNFVKAGVKRAKTHQSNADYEKDTDSDIGAQYDSQQPEWMDLLQSIADCDDVTSDFTYDDCGPDFDWSHISNTYPDNYGVIFLQNLNGTEEEKHFNPPQY